MNWRKPLLALALKLKGSPVMAILRELEATERATPEERQRRQERKLERLLRHAHRHVPYYREILEQSGVICADIIDLSRFDSVPLLSKSIIREQGDRLRADAGLAGRKPYTNSTGGSTGEPIRFWQDSVYDAHNTATKLYFMRMLGKDPGERELKIWGSDRDLFEGTIGWPAKLQFFIYNRQFANCFHLSERQIEKIIAQNNRFQPRLIWGYVDGLFAIAQYANRSHLKLHAPTAIVSAAGTLFPHMREEIERAFGAPVYNYYGSREMGAMACECPQRGGLHIFTDTHVFETVDQYGHPAMEREGEIVVTSLENYAMPLIRYRIGDRGTLTDRQCGCGRTMPLLSNISGRMMESFVNTAGDIIPPEYFIHLVGVVYNTGFIRRFQLVQETLQHIRIRIVLNESCSWKDAAVSFEAVAEKIRLVMGPECRITFEQAADIKPAVSGKYLYTVCLVKPPIPSAAGG